MDDENPKTPIKKERVGLEMKLKISGGKRSTPTGKRSSRCTRSQVDPDWSLHEMLILVNEIAGIESDFPKSLSSFQKWKIVSDNCTSLGVVRSLNQCRRQWEILIDGYKIIKDWEAQSGVSYWSLDNETWLELGLPLSFNMELFIFIDDNVKAKEDRSGTDTDSDPDFKLVGYTGSKKKRRCQPPRESKNEEQQEMAVKLREQADLIHSILRGDTECNSYKDLKSPGAADIQKDFRRLQGSELIKVLECLVGNIDRLSDLVEEG